MQHVGCKKNVKFIAKQVCHAKGKQLFSLVELVELIHALNPV